MSTAHGEYTSVWQQVKRWPGQLRRNLVGDIMESLEADQSGPEGEWDEAKNARRCELIDKEIEGTLSASERLELEILQRQAVASRDRVAPLPMKGAVKLHRELLRKKQQNTKCRG